MQFFHNSAISNALLNKFETKFKAGIIYMHQEKKTLNSLEPRIMKSFKENTELKSCVMTATILSKDNDVYMCQAWKKGKHWRLQK